MATKKRSKKASTRSKSTKAKGAQYDTLHELLLLKLRSLRDTEEQLVKALPKMAKAASNMRLQEAFSAHLDETRGHVERLEEALSLLNAGKQKIKVEAIRGLVSDAEWCIKNIKDRASRDASLIAAAQYVEHYEMAGYGSARAWAEQMGHTEVVDLLQQTLDEEGEANKKLTAIAESQVNETVASGM